MYESVHGIHSDCIKMTIAKNTFKHVDSESAIYRTICSCKIYYISATLSITSIECVFVAGYCICVSVQIVNGI